VSGLGSDELLGAPRRYCGLAEQLPGEPVERVYGSTPDAPPVESARAGGGADRPEAMGEEVAR